MTCLHSLTARQIAEEQQEIVLMKVVPQASLDAMSKPEIAHKCEKRNTTAWPPMASLSFSMVHLRGEDNSVVKMKMRLRVAW
jgi:hypothetical protein